MGTRIRTNLTSTNALVSRLDVLFKSVPRVELLLEGCDDKAGALKRVLKSVVDSSASLSTASIISLEEALVEFEGTLHDSGMTPSARINLVCSSASVLKSQVEAIVKEDYGTSAANAKELVINQQGISNSPTYMATLGNLSGLSDSALILNELFSSGMQCVPKAMAAGKAPEADPVARKVIENLPSLPTYLSSKVMGTAPDAYGIIPYMPTADTVSALKKLKFNDVPWHCEVYAEFVGTTPGARASLPTAPPSFTLVPNWPLHVSVVERLLVAVGVPEDTTDRLSGYLQAMASSSCVSTSRNAPAERILASFMEELTQHVAAAVAQPRSAFPIPVMPASTTATLFKAYIESTKAVLIREQSLFSGVSIDKANDGSLPPAKRSKTVKEAPKGNAAKVTRPEKDGMGIKASLCEVSSNNRYLRIGKSFYNLTAFKADASSADQKFELRPELVHLAFIAGDKKRKLQFLRKQPISASIESALEAPFKDFNASKYKLDGEPKDF